MNKLIRTIWLMSIHDYETSLAITELPDVYIC